MTFCAVCIADIVGQPRMEPLGRNNALVAVCKDCSTAVIATPPRMGIKRSRNDRARARYEEQQRAGMCVRGLKHGPATHGALCARCHETQTAYDRKRGPSRRVA